MDRAASVSVSSKAAAVASAGPAIASPPSPPPPPSSDSLEAVLGEGKVHAMSKCALSLFQRHKLWRFWTWETFFHGHYLPAKVLCKQPKTGRFSWTAAEDRYLIQGMQMFGAGTWACVRCQPGAFTRSRQPPVWPPRHAGSLEAIQLRFWNNKDGFSIARRNTNSLKCRIETIVKTPGLVDAIISAESLRELIAQRPEAAVKRILSPIGSPPASATSGRTASTADDGGRAAAAAVAAAVAAAGTRPQLSGHKRREPEGIYELTDFQRTRAAQDARIRAALGGRGLVRRPDLHHADQSAAAGWAAFSPRSPTLGRR